MSWFCSVCEKSFSRKDSMQRHVMSKHRNAGITQFQTVPTVFSQKCQRFRFEHPFTSMIAGMTGSGKTAWVRSLLQQASETIYPPPERIVWCYSQWQPAYTQMLVAMPHIEFVKGIPTALEQDSYFDVNKRNLIVFDDQMIDASKDKRIVNLFTCGSHHRNLSVIYIVQDLFHQGKGNRSIGLNSHYLVLFKNSRDKLQILTLAYQMYPRQTDFFLNQYEEAVKRLLLLILLFFHSPPAPPPNSIVFYPSPTRFVFFSTRFYKRLPTAILNSFCSNVSCSEQQSWFSSAVS